MTSVGVFAILFLLHRFARIFSHICNNQLQQKATHLRVAFILKKPLLLRSPNCGPPSFSRCTNLSLGCCTQWVSAVACLPVRRHRPHRPWPGHRAGGRRFCLPGNALGLVGALGQRAAHQCQERNRHHAENFSTAPGQPLPAAGQWIL